MMKKRIYKRNQRQKTWYLIICSLVLLILIMLLGQLWQERAMTADFSGKNLAPSFRYPFGTDWMGRDMFARTLTGLSMSIRIGLLTAAVSGVLACLLGLFAAVMGKTADRVVLGLIDLVMGVPHILLLILISFACGKGFWGVAVGISLTHWTSLARLIRGEVLQLKESQYIKIAHKMGIGRWKLAWKHMLPHLLPQCFMGVILLFPHAILHEASITFLGFGLPPEQPAIGVILSESMKYLSMGKWWLALFPGLLLVLTVMMFHVIGQGVCGFLNPGSAHR